MIRIVCAATVLLSAACTSTAHKDTAEQSCPVVPGETSAGTAAAPWGFGVAALSGAAPKQDTPAIAPPAALRPEPDIYHVVSAGKGLTLHKPMFILPYTYSPAFNGRRSEMLFQISLKQQLFGVPLYFAYTQKSFFDIYDSSESKPFRESDYNPELFYRLKNKEHPEQWWYLGADFGIEHESNGRGLPDSRSWNRLYIAPFQEEGRHLVYWKWWWRLPEDKSLPRTDPNRDDNPDIGSYYGYSELHYEQQFSSFTAKDMLNGMVRWNPVTGHAAASLLYTVPNNASDPDFFWTLYLFQGYGESLIDYNRPITRIGVGVSLAR